MNFNIHSQVGAKFKLVAHKGDGVPVRETDWFNNIVLDSGLARMSAGRWIDRCCVGTGNDTPSATQVSLSSFLAMTQNSVSALGSVNTTTQPYYRSRRVVWRFPVGVAAGNISEVGLGWGNSNLWNRALIKDENNNPTTITVLPDEYLDVISEIRDYPTLSLVNEFNLLNKLGEVISTHTATVSPYIYGSFHSFDQITPKGAAIYSGVKNDLITQLPSSSITTIDHTQNMAIEYPTPTSMRVVFTYPLDNAVGTHQSFALYISGLLGGGGISGNNCIYKFQISPTITKTNMQIMTYTFDFSWGRYEPT